MFSFETYLVNIVERLKNNEAFMSVYEEQKISQRLHNIVKTEYHMEDKEHFSNEIIFRAFRQAVNFFSDEDVNRLNAMVDFRLLGPTDCLSLIINVKEEISRMFEQWSEKYPQNERERITFEFFSLLSSVNKSSFNQLASLNLFVFVTRYSNLPVTIFDNL